METNATRGAGIRIPLLLGEPANALQPVTVGVPFPRGLLGDLARLWLADGAGAPIPVQTEVLDRWGDGSAAWVLVDFILEPERVGGGPVALCIGDRPGDGEEGRKPLLNWAGDEPEIDTGTLRVTLAPRHFGVFTEIRIGRLAPWRPARPGGLSLCQAGRKLGLVVQGAPQVEASGAVRATLRYDLRAPDLPDLLLTGRFSFFRGTSLVRATVKVHNSRRAEHPGGLWDLGDAGSILLEALDFVVTAPESPVILWRAEPGQESRRARAPFEIRQVSSGGANWNSINHVDASGAVTLEFQGYEVRVDGRSERGERAAPIVCAFGDSGGVHVSVPEFWQQFPKAIAVEPSGQARIGLFPASASGRHEIQGGEQKSQTFWLSFSAEPEPNLDSLAWTHRPALPRPSPEWIVQTGLVPEFGPMTDWDSSPLAGYLVDVLEGPGNLFEKRESIDEFGWRDFGEIFADHEGAYFPGPGPLISHYNNQYDQVLGLLLAHLRSPDRRWWELADPLARHVIDIDIYHTRRDKAAYAGGMFWFTDHYLSAHTCTHRTYSRHNRPADGSPYGGGPSTMHLFSTGIALYYYLTGDREARAAVVELADWLLRAEDGRLHPLGLVDDGPTGITSGPQVPHRASGNSINTLLDAWRLTGKRIYLEQAQVLIRRTCHPNDDVAARDLLDVENRWSYTVFFSSLSKFLDEKARLGELDEAYAHAYRTMAAYGRWMLEHEIPYFDQADRLEYPTESWGAQEFRKAKVLRLAARCVEPAAWDHFSARANQIAERGWHDLLRFPSRMVARAIALVLVEATADARLRAQGVVPLPAPPDVRLARHARFVGIKDRVRMAARSPAGAIRMGVRLLNPARWLAWRSPPTEPRLAEF